MSRTAFVTGATGFLGVNLVEQLCAAGWQVIALHRHTSSTTWLRAFPARTVVGDILDARTLLAAMPADGVFMMIGKTCSACHEKFRQKME